VEITTVYTTSLEPRNRRVADPVRSSNIRHSLARLAPRNRLLSLEWSELGLATKSYASGHRSLPTLRRSRKDHRAFEFSQCREHRKDQLAVGAGRIDHRISKRLEAGALLGCSIKNVQQIACTPG
jgi:hypothetical protein